VILATREIHLYIGRDGRDVIFSLYSHHANATEDWYRAINASPGRGRSAGAKST
jgi:aryl sulfotransferase